MPSVKQGGGYTLTFSKKNKDVKTLLEDVQKEGVKITDYLCDAVRFFNENKDADIRKDNTDIQELKDLINSKFKDLDNKLDYLELKKHETSSVAKEIQEKKKPKVGGFNRK